MWKDGKNDFDAFLQELNAVDRAEVTELGTLHDLTVFSLEATAPTSQPDVTL